MLAQRKKQLEQLRAFSQGQAPDVPTVLAKAQQTGVIRIFQGIFRAGPSASTASKFVLKMINLFKQILEHN